MPVLNNSTIPLRDVTLSMDPGTVLFRFSKSNIAVNKIKLFQEYDPTGGSYSDNGGQVHTVPPTHTTFYDSVIMKMMQTDILLVMYYKTLGGVWVNLTAAQLAYPRADMFVTAETNPSLFLIDETLLPETEYIDADGFIKQIPSCDGTFDEVVATRYINESYNGDVDITLCSIDNPAWTMVGNRHLMQDLKIKLKNGVINDHILVWINGIFVPIYKDQSLSDTFYIRDIVPMLTTRVIDQDGDSPNDIYPFPNLATKVLDFTHGKTRYNIVLRIFAWDRVTVNPWSAPTYIQTEPYVYLGEAAYYPKFITFNDPITPNHLIMENGIILNSKQYSLDPLDPKRIILHGVRERALELLNGIVASGDLHPMFTLSKMITYPQYGLINFQSDIVDDKFRMIRDKNAKPNTPYYRDISFDNINVQDLIVVDGNYIPYLWRHEKRISLPMYKYSNPMADVNVLKSACIERITFYRNNDKKV